MPSALKAWNLNHWIAGKIPIVIVNLSVSPLIPGKAPSSGLQQLGSRRGQHTRVPVGAPSTTNVHAWGGPRRESGCVPFYNLQSSLFSKEFKEFAHEGNGKKPDWPFDWSDQRRKTVFPKPYCS